MAVNDRKQLEQGLAALGLTASEQQLRQLLDYQAFLGKWNRAYNLVAAGEMDDFVVRHLLDSLAIAPHFDEAQTIIDVGSGAGLPGIPLAILMPDRQFVLLDSNSKKTRFLFQAVLALSLGNVEVANCRVEHYQSPRQIDIVTCRAFAALGEIVDKARHCFHPQTLLLAMKGRFPDEEIAQLPHDFGVHYTRKLAIPENNSERHLIAVRMQP